MSERCCCEQREGHEPRGVDASRSWKTWSPGASRRNQLHPHLQDPDPGDRTRINLCVQSHRVSGHLLPREPRGNWDSVLHGEPPGGS